MAIVNDTESRDYIDSGVVLTAWRGDERLKRAARAFLSRLDRTLVASSLMRLETWPKAAYRANLEELSFFNSIFYSIDEWIPIEDALIEAAIELGRHYDIVNLDALHAAAAIRGGADRFVTTERPGKPLYRLTEVKVVYLLDL